MRRTWLSPPAIVLLFIVAIPASIALLDRPAARFAHDAFGHHAVFLALTRPPEYLARLALVLLVALGLRAMAAPLGPFARGLLLGSLSVTIAEALNNFLKLCFGRTWPETWVAHNPSWIEDRVFLFVPFHGGAGWASFPSGHMAVTGACVGVFWLLAPRWRGLMLWPVWGLCLALVALGLFGMDYHFVSDMIAGTGLGVAVAAVVVRLAGRRVPAGR